MSALRARHHAQLRTRADPEIVSAIGRDHFNAWRLHIEYLDDNVEQGLCAAFVHGSHCQIADPGFVSDKNALVRGRGHARDRGPADDLVAAYVLCHFKVDNLAWLRPQELHIQVVLLTQANPNGVATQVGRGHGIQIVVVVCGVDVEELVVQPVDAIPLRLIVSVWAVVGVVEQIESAELHMWADIWVGVGGRSVRTRDAGVITAACA